jgi:hypothetical protein
MNVIEASSGTIFKPAEFHAIYTDIYRVEACNLMFT